MKLYFINDYILIKKNTIYIQLAPQILYHERFFKVMYAMGQYPAKGEQTCLLETAILNNLINRSFEQSMVYVVESVASSTMKII